MLSLLRPLLLLFVACIPPAGVAHAQLLSEGDILVTDLFSFAEHLTVFDSAGAFETSTDFGNCSPFDVEVDPEGEVFISESGGEIHRLAPGESPDCVKVGDTGSSNSLGITIAPNGILYVVDGSQVFGMDTTAFNPGDIGANRQVVGSGGDVEGASDVVAAANGMLFVATTLGPVVRLDPEAYDPGDPTSNQTQVGQGAASQHADVTIGPTGELFVSELSLTSRIVRFDPDSFDAINPTANQLMIYSGFTQITAVAFDTMDRLLALGRFGVILVDLDEELGPRTFLASGDFGVPFIKLAVATTVPALGATPSTALVALLFVAARWFQRRGAAGPDSNVQTSESGPV